MPVHASKSDVRSVCDICGERELPRVDLYHPAEPDTPVVVCIDCLGGWIEMVTGWRVRTTLARWAVASAAAARFRDLGQTTKRSHRRRTAG